MKILTALCLLACAPALFAQSNKPAPLSPEQRAVIQAAQKLQMDEITRKLEEATVKDRLTKYNSHVSFHLYQMYNEQKRRNDEREKLVEPDDLRAEINRVGSTLIRVMEVSR